MAINRSNIKLQVTRGNKMKMKKRKAGGSFPDVTGDGETTMKDVLVKRGVLEKKGDKFVVAKKEKGGGLEEDIKKIKTGKKASDMKAPPSRKPTEMKAPPSKRVSEINKRGAAKKPRDAFRKPLRKRKGGGMVYQLYGGSTKDFSDGNKFIQSFYDKG
jgi:hypothetical protein